MVNKIQYPNHSHGNDFPRLLFMNSVLRTVWEVIYQKQTSPHEIKNPSPIDKESVFIRISAQPRISVYLE